MGTSTKKCPLCNRKLAPVNGIPTCPDCGYKEPQGSGATASYSQREEPAKEKKAAVSGKAVVGAIGSVTAAIVVGVILTFVKRGLLDAMNSAADTIGSKWLGESSETPEARVSEENSGPEESRPRLNDIKAYQLPRSVFLAALVEELFQKPVNQVSYEEISSIVYLEAWYPEDSDVMQVNVMLADGTEQGYLMSDYDIDTADLNCLEGLQYLFLDDESISYGTDWHNLKQLQVLSCDASMRDLTGYMDVSQLVWLYTGDTFAMSDLSVLSEFTSLEHLELDVGLLNSIAGISQAASLRELYLMDADRVSDFSELYEMQELVALGIESKGLKDIGFVSSMDNLQRLELKGTEIRSISALSDCADTLVSLILDDNYQIADLSPVMECVGLEELQLWVDYQFDVLMEAPDFSAMTGLKSLSIENYDRFTNLALLTGLEELTIEGVGSGDGKPLESLTNLRTLRLIDMSVYEGFIDSVARLENLEYLSLEDSFIWSDISPVFGMPSLQQLDMEDAECGLRQELLTVNDSLLSLNLVHTDFDRLLPDGRWNYGDEEEIPVQEVLDAMAPCMPNLRWLYVPAQDLENLNFTDHLTQLAWLDMRDNYITDLTPLTKLETLTVLLCEDNPIRSTEGLEDVLIFQ